MQPMMATTARTLLNGAADSLFAARNAIGTAEASAPLLDAASKLRQAESSVRVRVGTMHAGNLADVRAGVENLAPHAASFEPGELTKTFDDWQRVIRDAVDQLAPQVETPRSSPLW